MHFSLCGKQCICLRISLFLVLNIHSSILYAGHCMSKEPVIVIFYLLCLSFLALYAYYADNFSDQANKYHKPEQIQ